MIYLVIFLFGLPSLMLSIDFLQYLITGRRLFHRFIIRLLEIVGMLGFPVFYLWMFDDKLNNCCSESATFSPGHKLTIYVIFAICNIAYFYSSFKKEITGPIIEVLINSLLLLGFLFNFFVGIQVGFYSLFGNLPVALLFIFRIADNHKKIIAISELEQPGSNNNFVRIGWGILKSNLFIKLPILLILCLPFLIIISSLLLLFGQKPDSLIRAFTDTYKHGFSQLDYLCDNVECGGHFLCSVAANGHKDIVHPIRYGERKANKIICNRQLLIANAFEELLQQKLPRIHKFIRYHYNKVGNIIHRHYRIFNNKFIADFIYILMKPLEILFLLILYTFDQKPENRISMQYLNKLDRQAIRQLKYDRDRSNVKAIITLSI